MIVTRHGDLLDAKGVIVHGCNSCGVMGSGVALQIKNKWPEAFESYRNFLQNHREHYCNSPLGLIAYSYPETSVWVANMITQQHFGRDKNKVYVDYEAIKTGFKSLNSDLKLQNRLSMKPITTVNFPLIGCGLGNGNWKIISEIIDEELDDSLEKVLWLQD